MLILKIQFQTKFKISPPKSFLGDNPRFCFVGVAPVNLEFKFFKKEVLKKKKKIKKKKNVGGDFFLSSVGMRSVAARSAFKRIQ